MAFLTAVIRTVIIANNVLSGRLEVGLAVQAAGAFAAMLIALTMIVNHFEGLSRFSAVVERLYTFSQALGSQPLGWSTKHEKDTQNNKIVKQQDLELTCNHLSICTPTGERTLIKQLNLSVGPNKGLMIVGESGTCKSSLLRDESTSALDAANESRLYVQLSVLDITPISVSHRQALLQHQYEVLVVLGDSGWRMVKACEFKWDD